MRWLKGFELVLSSLLPLLLLTSFWGWLCLSIGPLYLQISCCQLQPSSSTPLEQRSKKIPLKGGCMNGHWLKCLGKSSRGVWNVPSVAWNGLGYNVMDMFSKSCLDLKIVTSAVPECQHSHFALWNINDCTLMQQPHTAKCRCFHL